MKKIMMLVIACMGVLFLAGCSDDPQDVAKKWAQALEKQDVETANKYSTEKTQFFNMMIVDAVKKDQGNVRKNLDEMISKVSSSKVEINGDEAVITVNTNDKDTKYKMKKVDGKWKVNVSK